MNMVTRPFPSLPLETMDGLLWAGLCLTNSHVLKFSMLKPQSVAIFVERVSEEVMKLK